MILTSLLGLSHSKIDQIDAALFCFETACRFDPNDDDYWCQRGIMLFKKKKLDEAKECFTKSLLINSTNASAMNGLTSCQLVSANYDRA